MNTIDCIKTRRSVRKFKDEQIKDDELIQVLEAGTWSPTSMGAQHPHIIAVQNPAFIGRLRKMNAEVMAPRAIPITVRPPSSSSSPTGAMAMKFMTAALSYRP